MIRLTEMFNFADSSTYGKLKPQLGQVVSNPYARAFAPQVKEGEEPDHEVSMANNALDTIIQHATELKSKIGQNEKNLPAWIQDHITNSENYISQAAHNYHEYGKNESKQQIKEGNNFEFPHWSGNVNFYTSAKNGKIILLPASTKDRDGIDLIKQKIGGKATQYRFAQSGMGKGGEADFLELLKQQLEKKLKLKVVLDKGYPGAGYAFEIDTDDLLKKL
jgi:hypothetical protein